MTCPSPPGLGPCACADCVGTSSRKSKSNGIKSLNVFFMNYTPRGTPRRVNRQIDTDHKRLIPANAETRTIHIKGDRKSGTTSNMTEPARSNACKLVIRKTAQPINAVIWSAGEAKKDTR